MNQYTLYILAAPTNPGFTIGSMQKLAELAGRGLDEDLIPLTLRKGYYTFFYLIPESLMDLSSFYELDLMEYMIVDGNPNNGYFHSSSFMAAPDTQVFVQTSNRIDLFLPGLPVVDE